MVWDTEGTLIDRRRAKRRPPQGSRLVHDDGSCGNPRCVDVDHLSTEPLQDPPPEPEHDRTWARAIITTVRPPANPGLPWWATFESTTRRGSFPLDEKRLKALGLAEGGSAALEHELLLEYRGETGPTGICPVPPDDEWVANGNPAVAELTPTRQLPPSDPCPCLSGSQFGVCHGKPKQTYAIAMGIYG